jgi:hypothetical protein
MWQRGRGQRLKVHRSQPRRGMQREKGMSTYGDFGIGLQGKCSKLRLLFISGGKRDGILRANAQCELLAPGGDTGDGLEAGLEMGYGP